MDNHESNSFDKLPDEVLQLIFGAIRDCKSLVHCTAVSKAFQTHASKVTTLKITCPGQFSTYDQKIWNIYSMVKTFRALQSLIVCIGQPKNEPPTSWARCMRYAEIGTSVEKFVFMAAKSGDFVEFDFALGLRSQLLKDHVKNLEGEFTLKNKKKYSTLKNINKHESDRGLFIDDEIGCYGRH
ncbi:hypothetical protein KC19_6G037600 [Ceratodon purpureus]|uniref:F-box domain-containing protein n=1 Tax=Ceratodon purpureus TaxID=3225 RepID=A0A8T0HEY6_CERPU|nr:hypothetical protein KC19_6G037600 [Ceratodon purpureus]